MTPAGMAAMRIAATLAHVLPGVRVRLHHGSLTLLDVGHPDPAPPGAVDACTFRRAVACAHERGKRGISVRFAGLAPGADPAVDIGIPTGDAALPGGVYRVRLGTVTVHGFATTLPLRHCRLVLEALPDTGHVVRLHHDAATEVTFVHTVSPTVDAPAGAAHLAPALEALFADEVVRELAETIL